MSITFPFKKKSIVIQETLGEKLKKIRLGKDWTLAKASQQTKISTRYLNCLEKALYDDIPGEVYIKNFIRSYSKVLGLKPEKALLHYEKERHVIERKKYHNFLNGLDKIPLIQMFLKPAVLKISAICLIVGIVLSYITFNVYHTIAPPPLAILFPTEDIEIYAPFVTIRGKSDPKAHVSINEKEVTTNEDGTFKLQITLRNGLNLIVITSQRKHGFVSRKMRHVLVNKEKTMAREYK